MHSVQPSVMVETPRDAASRASHKFAFRPVAWAKGFAMIVSLAASQAFAQTPPATASSAMAASASADGVYDLLIGTYTGSGKSEGIYVYRFDTKNGDLTRLASAQAVNPSYLIVSRDRQYVYAVNELPGRQRTRPRSAAASARFTSTGRAVN